MALCALTYFLKSSRPTVDAHLHPPIPIASFNHLLRSFIVASLPCFSNLQHVDVIPTKTPSRLTTSGGGGEYTGRRVDDTMQVIHAEVLLRATTLDLESVFFFFCYLFGAVETRGSGFLRSPLTKVVVLNEPMVGRRLLLTTMSRF